MYSYNFPRPAITVDTVILHALPFNEWEVLLIKRGGEPFINEWALPGGYLEIGSNERVLDAAYREMREEVMGGISEHHCSISKYSLQFIGFYDDPKRHPTDRVINFAYVVRVANTRQFIAGDDAKEIKWVPVLEIDRLAFDHKKIVMDAVNRIDRCGYA